MGVGKVLKGIGKVALKTAPIWMSVVPGVGTAAGMALSGAASMADKKLSGGSWKSSLLAGGIGAGSSLAAGQAGKLLGKVGESGGDMGYVKNAVSGVEKAASGGSKASKLLGGFGGYMKDNPMLPLAAMSLLGGAGGDGGGGGNGRRGYDPHGFSNPEDAMNRALQAIHRSGQSFFEAPNQHLGPLMSEGNMPKPVNVAGIQIGGGLGHNPAMDDMEIDRSGLQQYDPMQSVGGVDKFKAQPRRIS